MKHVGQGAVGASVCIHAALALAIGYIEIERREPPPRAPRLVWLGTLPELPHDAEADPPADPAAETTSPNETATREREPRPDDPQLSAVVREPVTPPPLLPEVEPEIAREPATEAPREAATEDDNGQPTADRPAETPATDEAWREHTRARRARLQIIDLEAATALALSRAQDRLDRDKNLVTFSLADIPRIWKPSEPGSRGSVFEPPSTGREGTTYRTALGETVVWTSDRCFQTSRSASLFAFPAGEDIFALPTTNCVGSDPRDDLFEPLRRDRHLDTRQEPRE